MKKKVSAMKGLAKGAVFLGPVGVITLTIVLFVLMVVTVFVILFVTFTGFMVVINENPDYQFSYVPQTQEKTDVRQAPKVSKEQAIFMPMERVYITSLYGYRTLNGRTQFHSGLDLGYNLGEAKIYPVRPGVVVHVVDYSKMKAYKVPTSIQDKVGTGLGQVVVVKHEDIDLYSSYAHLFRVHVSKGDIVGMDDVLGIMGNTGDSFGAHLHLSIYKSFDYTNNVGLSPMNPLNLIYCPDIVVDVKGRTRNDHCFDYRK